MSKIIRMTPEMIDQAKIEFERRLKAMNCVDGRVTYVKAFESTNQKAVVWFTPDAYTKMIALIQDSDKEVAWHGVAHRAGDRVGEYVISDILVYPQEVTGATVNTDQAEYEMWLMEQEDDVFNNIRMQGHSHVNMPTSPSGTDLEHQAKIVQQLEGDMFYIFMIWNKHFKYTAKIYDLKINTLFEPGDISIQMVGASNGIAEFLQEARSMVRTKSYSYQGGGNNYGGYRPASTTPTTTPAASTTAPQSANSGSNIPSRPKSCIGNGWSGKNNYVDYEDPYDRFCN